MFSSALNCLLVPYFSQKKKKKGTITSQAPVLLKPTHVIIPHAFSILGFICTYLLETGFSLVSYLHPLKSASFLTAAGAGFHSHCQTTGFLMEIEICSISLNKQKHYLYLKCFLNSHFSSIHHNKDIQLLLAETL